MNRDTHPERWLEGQFPKKPAPDPDWPEWAVELEDKFGNRYGGSWHLPAPDAETAAAWVDDLLDGTGHHATRNVWPATLPVCHHRYAATEAVRAQWTLEGRLTPPPAFAWLWVPLAWRGALVSVKVGVYHRDGALLHWKAAGNVVTAEHRTPVKHAARFAAAIAAEPSFAERVERAWAVEQGSVPQ
jgi:hypothetical protein